MFKSRATAEVPDRCIPKTISCIVRMRYVCPFKVRSAAFKSVWERRSFHPGLLTVWSYYPFQLLFVRGITQPFRLTCKSTSCPSPESAEDSIKIPQTNLDVFRRRSFAKCGANDPIRCPGRGFPRADRVPFLKETPRKKNGRELQNFSVHYHNGCLAQTDAVILGKCANHQFPKAKDGEARGAI